VDAKEQDEYGSIGNGHVELEKIEGNDNAYEKVDKSSFIMFTFGNS